MALTLKEKWNLALKSPQEVLTMCITRETQVLNQAVMSSVNQLSNGYDVDIIEAKIQTILEIAEGLGVDLDVQISRKLLFQRVGKKMREKLDGII